MASPTPTQVVQIPRDRVTVQLRVIQDASWVYAVSSTGAVLQNGTLTAGQTMTWTDPTKIRLVIGRAGNIDLVVNGIDLGPAGASAAQVARVTFTPNDPATGHG